MNIAEILPQQAALRPDAPALIETKRGQSHTLTYAEMERASARAAALLQQSGLRPGDAVLIFIPMSAELYIALMAVFRLGAITMFLDPSAGKEHIARCCTLSPPQALIAGTKAHLLCLLVPSLRRIPRKFVLGTPLPGLIPWQRADRLAPHDAIHPCAPETPALLTFTSGSTGQPKAALRTHGFLLAQHRALEQTIGLPPGAIDLAALPVFVLANLASGLTSLIPNADLRRPGAIVPAPVLAQIRAHAPARVGASPAFLERLADHCLASGQTLPEFREIFTGGAPVFPRLLDKLHAVAPQAAITAVYGSTEAEPIAEIERRALRPEDRAAMLGGKGLLTGPPVPVIRLRILRDQWGRPVGPYTEAEFEAACQPNGEVGEIVVSGEHVLTGYLHGRGDEETKFRVGETVWHRTGDAGYLDAEGRLWLLGRCDAIIADAQGTLYPFAVECAAMHHPGVLRAALVSHQGQRLLAVELAPSAEAATLSELKETLAWACLSEIRVFPRIPVDRRHNAKIDYPALRRLLSGE